jgi:adenylylsulfate kinase
VGTVNVLLLTGAPGVGKTTLAEEMFDQLAARGVRHAIIDVDALCMSFPFRPGDHFNDITALQNLRAVWRNYARQGIDQLILVRVVETMDDVRRLAEAIPGAEVMVCRLRASAATVEERLRRREVGSSAESLVARGRQLAQRDHDDGVANMVVDTEGIALPDLARSILEKVGW